MRASLHNGLGDIELIDRNEPDWEYVPICESPELVAARALGDDVTPGGARVRALLANTLASGNTPGAPSQSFTRALEGALRSGAIRLTGWRTAAPMPLAGSAKRSEPVAARPAAPRVARAAPAQAPPPEEDTAADAQCLVDAAAVGAPLVNPG